MRLRVWGGAAGLPQSALRRLTCGPRSVFQVQAQRVEVHRPAVMVEARIADVLKIRSQLHAHPRAPWRTGPLRPVVSLENLLTRIVEPPVAQYKSQAPGAEVSVVRTRKSLDDHGGAQAIVGAPPAHPRELCPEAGCTV